MSCYASHGLGIEVRKTVRLCVSQLELGRRIVRTFVPFSTVAGRWPLHGFGIGSDGCRRTNGCKTWPWDFSTRGCHTRSADNADAVSAYGMHASCNVCCNISVCRDSRPTARLFRTSDSVRRRPADRPGSLRHLLARGDFPAVVLGGATAPTVLLPRVIRLKPDSTCRTIPQFLFCPIGFPPRLTSGCLLCFSFG